MAWFVKRLSTTHQTIYLAASALEVFSNWALYQLTYSFIHSFKHPPNWLNEGLKNAWVILNILDIASIHPVGLTTWLDEPTSSCKRGMKSVASILPKSGIKIGRNFPFFTSGFRFPHFRTQSPSIFGFFFLYGKVLFRVLIVQFKNRRVLLKV